MLLDSLRNPLRDAIDIIKGNRADAVVLSGSKPFSLDDCDLTALLDDGSWAANTALRTLDLSLNRITDCGIDNMSRHFATSASRCTLASIDLNGNVGITDRGAMTLLGSLPPSVLRIDLSSNQLSDTFLMFLPTFLQHPTSGSRCSPSSLLLRNCAHFTDDGLEALMVWLTESRYPLVTLHVSGNPFTDRVVNLLCTLVASNHPTLIDFNISNCNIFDVIPVANACVASNSTLVSLSLGTNGKKLVHPQLDGKLKMNRKHSVENEMKRMQEPHYGAVGNMHAAHVEICNLRERIRELGGKSQIVDSKLPF